MLEKIGLPAKPSLRGNNWVVDASHCQGCSSQFTFINRKHHCRRCGGLFCNSCTQQRMYLRGQGESPVRVCEPCKKLEEAARFEMRLGYRSRAPKGSSKQTLKYEDEVLNQILGRDGKDSSLGLLSSNDMGSSMQRATSSASSSNVQDAVAHDGLGDTLGSHSFDDLNSLRRDMGSASPEELRQRAVEEKKKYKILKGEGKPEDALRAYKRGKELERQAEALELSLRKNRKKILSSGNKADTQNKDSFKESGRKTNQFPKTGAERDDFASELKELGWSDMDIRHEDKKHANMSLEGELSSLLGDVIPKTGKDAGTRGIDKTPVVALKRKALTLKREGKLAEAKEELKKAKILEKQLEEQELLNEAGDSDDELSAIIQSIDNDEQDDLLIQYEQKPDFDHFISTADDLGVESNFEVTDEDMENPEIAAALKSLGWTEDSDHPDNIVSQSAPLDREALSMEILSLKREALNQKQAGNVAEAMAHLKKAKLIERDLEGFESQGGNLVVRNPRIIQTVSISQDFEKLSKTAEADEGNIDFTKGMDYKVARKSRSMIQKELLGLKRNALVLRREGKIDEAEEELKKCKVLEDQLEEIDNASKVKTTGTKEPNLAYKDSVTIDLPVGEGDVTDQDMQDPTYASVLRNLGWNDEDNEVASHPSKPSKQKDKFSENITESPLMEATSDIPARASSRNKAELQRELLSLKRKALSLRRQGKNDEAEEVLKAAKVLEDKLAEKEAPKKFQAESNWPRDRVIERPLEGTIDKGVEEDVAGSDMHDPDLPSVLKNVGWKDEELGSVTMLEKPSKEVSGNLLHSTGPSATQSALDVSVAVPRSKEEIQRQLLNLKRKALTLRRQGESEEAEEFLKMVRVLEAQMEELEAPRDNLLDTLKKDLGSFESLVSHEKQVNLVPHVGVNMGSAMMAVFSDDKAIKSSLVMELDHPLLRESGLSGETRLTRKNEAAKSTVIIPSSSQSVNLMDLMIGNNWTSSQAAGKPEDEGNFGSDISSGKTAFQMDSLSNLHEDLGSKNDIQTDKGEVFHVYENPDVLEANSAQGSASQSKQTSLQQEVLAHKRKAVALKREGKLAEAREELRLAKVLEKSLEEDKIQPKTISPDVSKTTSKLPSDGRKEDGASNLATKPLSTRDRFKLQQESLGHKRKALKLRRDGQVDEAEAEFEKAKNLEAQLEELAAQDSKSSANEAESINDIVVEDFLDPQLLSALKAIGLDDANMTMERPEKSEPVKHGVGKGNNLSQERSQLEEQIKAEKVKAVKLKRSGKQAEALDALRRAKLFEKKLNSLASN